MNKDGCDNCGQVGELYHFDAEVEGNPFDGSALCDHCTSLADTWDSNALDEKHVEAEIEVEDFHAELQRIIEHAEGTPLALLVPQAQALLALPEESVAALVAAAQSMVGAASFGR